MEKHPIFIDVVFDQYPNSDGARFIEVENNAGKSVTIGEWVTRVDGTVALRIRDTDIGDLY